MIEPSKVHTGNLKTECKETRNRTMMSPTTDIDSQAPTIWNRLGRESSFSLRTNTPSCNLRPNLWCCRRMNVTTKERKVCRTDVGETLDIQVLRHLTPSDGTILLMAYLKTQPTLPSRLDSDINHIRLFVRKVPFINKGIDMCRIFRDQSVLLLCQLI